MSLPEINPEELLQRDVGRLLGQHRRLKKMSSEDPKRAKALADFEATLASSRAKVQARAAAAPTPAYDPDLPITARKDDIVSAIRDHRVVVVAGATGSGKSTQLPKMVLEAGRGRRGLIGCTQPRRIAARSVARRVAEELGTELGGAVGFQVRFTDRVSDATFVKFMTDGILLAEVHGDRRLDRYDTLIIDEAHERSLNIDFLLGYLKQLLDRRPDLKIVITSATIDTARFAEHFGDAPVIDVEGRSYPVTVEYQPPNEGEALEQQVRRAVGRATRIDARGDILVFLPGEREIFQASRALSKAGLADTEILPLYARLPAGRQDAIFKPGVGRRIVLATNVAETSLTVPGIRFVIDSGLARISRYASHSKVLRLPVEPVSKASCNQRAGRCGRVGPGTCIRLFDEADFDARPDYTEPEIQRAGLVGVVLEMLALGLGDPEDFPFIDPPPRKLVNEAWSTLVELEAVDDARSLTPLGRQLATLPVDARHGRMLIEAAERGALAEALVLVAALGVQDPRERPPDQQQAADEAHGQFKVAGSDFLGLLELWTWWQELRSERSRSQADKQAKRTFLSPLRLHEWGQLVAQLRELCRSNGWKVGAVRELDEPVAESVHRALLSGLLAQVGRHDEDGEYVGARGHRMRIFPGSTLGRSRPGWIMAAELVETSRTWARTVAAIKPEWLEQQAGHLTRSHVFDPHWDKRSGRVMGYQQVTLYGLTLVEKRRVHYGPHDPATARELMIRHALVHGEMNFKAGFLKRNRQLVEELATHEHKRRSRDVLADESARVAFFDERLPPQIFTVKAFGRWYEGLDDKERNALLYDHATLMREDAVTPGEEYPDRLELDGEVFQLDYRFEPAHPADGVTVICPLHRLNRLDPDRLQWLVPGLRADAVKGLIGTLPKSKRRSFVPLADYAQAALEALGEPDGSLHERLAAELSRIGGLEIAPEDFQLERLDDHLRFNVRVLGESGRLLAESRDLEALQDDLGEKARREFMARQADEWQRDGLASFEDLVLPKQVRTRAGDPAWPALIDQGASGQRQAVGLRLFDDEAEARAAHHGGIHRLLLVRLADKLKYIAKSHRLSQQAALAWTRVEDVAVLERASSERVVGDAIDDAWSIRSGADLDALEARLRPEIVDRCRAAIEALDRTVLRWHEVRRRLDEIGPAQPSAHEDIQSQLDDLVYPSFVTDVASDRLTHYPRYLDAIDARLDALELDPRRDVQRQAETDPWWQRYLDHLAAGRAYSDALDRYRWLIEEYRVQVFAQQLGTAEKVSKKRLENAWAEVRREAGGPSGAQ